MKIFPERLLNVELEDNYSRVSERLTNETDLTENLTSTWTNKKFRGTVTQQGFKLISSEIGRGAVCVFIGEFQDNSGTIRIRLNKAFQIMFGIILAYLPIAAGLILFMEHPDKWKLLINVVLGFFFIRFVFIELSFRFLLRTGLNKLKQTLNIANIQNET